MRILFWIVVTVPMLIYFYLAFIVVLQFKELGYYILCMVVFEGIAIPVIATRIKRNEKRLRSRN